VREPDFCRGSQALGEVLSGDLSARGKARTAVMAFVELPGGESACFATAINQG